jgi:AcrR family transcriptional regulator
VHDVQRKVDVSIGSIYKYFGGKEGIATALYTRLLSEFDEMMDNIMDQHKGAKERGEAIIRQLFEYTETHTHIIAYVLHAKHTEFIPKELPVYLCATPLPLVKFERLFNKKWIKENLEKQPQK